MSVPEDSKLKKYEVNYVISDSPYFKIAVLVLLMSSFLTLICVSWKFETDRLKRSDFGELLEGRRKHLNSSD